MVRVKYINEKFQSFNEDMDKAFAEFHEAVNSHQDEIMKELCKDMEKYAPCDMGKLYDAFTSELYHFYYKEAFVLHERTCPCNDIFDFGSPFQLYEYFIRFDNKSLIELLMPSIPFEEYFMQLVLCTSAAVKNLEMKANRRNGDLEYGAEYAYYKNKINNELIHWFYYELVERTEY